MKVKVGDYVIFVTTNKPQLGVISNIDPLRVQLEPDEKLKRPIVDIQADNIQAVLGAKTISGTAFGIDVANRYVDLVENGNFGDLALYGYGIKQHVKVLKSAFSIVYKCLNKKGVPTDGLQEILFKAAPLKGTMAGLCKAKRINVQSRLIRTNAQLRICRWLLLTNWGIIFGYHLNRT